MQGMSLRIAEFALLLEYFQSIFQHHGISMSKILLKAQPTKLCSQIKRVYTQRNYQNNQYRRNLKQLITTMKTKQKEFKQKYDKIKQKKESIDKSIKFAYSQCQRDKIKYTEKYKECDQKLILMGFQSFAQSADISPFPAIESQKEFSLNYSRSINNANNLIQQSNMLLQQLNQQLNQLRQQIQLQFEDDLKCYQVYQVSKMKNNEYDFRKFMERRQKDKENIEEIKRTMDQYKKVQEDQLIKKMKEFESFRNVICLKNSKKISLDQIINQYKNCINKPIEQFKQSQQEQKDQKYSYSPFYGLLQYLQTQDKTYLATLDQPLYYKWLSWIMAYQHGLEKLLKEYDLWVQLMGEYEGRNWLTKVGKKAGMLQKDIKELIGSKSDSIKQPIRTFKFRQK